MQPVLLLAPAALSAIHAAVLVCALLPVDVLLVGVQVQQGQQLAPSVVRPKRGDDFLLYGTGVTEKKKEIVFIDIRRSAESAKIE